MADSAELSVAATSSLANEAYSVVRQRILRGDLVLGQPISRRKLAVELGMSFLPVSEALLKLEFEGLLESRPRAGTRVRIPSPEDVEGNYVVREALETQAAILFAQAAAPAERAELRKLAERVDALTNHAERSVYVALHHKLHYRIAECTRCNALREAIEKTQALASIWFAVVGAVVPDAPPTTRHQELVEALNSGDTVRAAAAVREHIAVSRLRTLETLEPYFRLRAATGRRFSRTDKQMQRVAAPTAV